MTLAIRQSGNLTPLIAAFINKYDLENRRSQTRDHFWRKMEPWKTSLFSIDYLGPWHRTIEVAGARGVWVACHGHGIFKVRKPVFRVRAQSLPDS